MCPAQGKHAGPPIRAVVGLLLTLILVSGPAPAQQFSGRQAVLYRLGQVKLAENPPYVPRTSDCSYHAWDLLSRVLPSSRAYSWFTRTPAAAMSRWPWPNVYTRVDLRFGDTLFFAKVRRGRISHVGLQWVRGMAHASSSRGFVEQPLGPYWTPKLAVAKRPPY
jgi:cell wall-associated NlpC family hydrolase